MFADARRRRASPAQVPKGRGERCSPPRPFLRAASIPAASIPPWLSADARRMVAEVALGLGPCERAAGKIKRPLFRAAKNY